MWKGRKYIYTYNIRTQRVQNNRMYGKCLNTIHSQFHIINKEVADEEKRRRRRR